METTLLMLAIKTYNAKGPISSLSSVHSSLDNVPLLLEGPDIEKLIFVDIQSNTSMIKFSTEGGSRGQIR